MTRSALILVLLFAAFAAAQEARSSVESPEETRRKRIAALTEEIESIAAGEPPQIGVDTWLRASEAVASTNREKARTYAEYAIERASTLKTELARSTFLSLAGQEMVKYDTEKAEEACRAIPRKPALQYESDPKSACWASRIAHEQNPVVRGAVTERSLDDGAYSTFQHGQTLSSLQKVNPEAAGMLYSRFVSTFPEKEAGLPELQALLAVVNAMGPEQQEISRQALELAVRCIERKDFKEPARKPTFRTTLGNRTELTTVGARESLSLAIADLAWLVSPDLLESHAELLGRWREKVAGGDWSRRRNGRFREKESSLDSSLDVALGLGDLPSIDFEKLSPSEIRGLIPSLQDQRSRVLALSQLFEKSQGDREELKKSREELAKSVELLPDASRLKLMVVFLLLDEALNANEIERATPLGRQLLATFDASMGCESEACELASAEMLPGELAWEFLGHLKSLKVNPLVIGMNHRSLTSRQSIKELKELLEQKKPRAATKEEP